MGNTVNLLKLSVGSESVASLAAWQATAHERWADGIARHVTRMWPKREAEILNGGSIYWVVKGAIQCRQRITAMEEVIGADGIRRCAIVLDPQIIRTTAALRRPFQGWRYLKVEDSPADLPKGTHGDDALPPELSAALADIGVL